MRSPPRRPDHPNVYWHGDNNVGDVLGGWIATAISGKPTRFTHHAWRESKTFVTGSIMSLADHTTTVWGAGVAWRNDPIDPQCHILAVRGPLTRKRALECGAECPEVYGDPALLMPRLYEPVVAERYSIGIIPHIIDREYAFGRYQNSDPAVLCIDVTHSPESVINGIAECDMIVSSSLHGLILAAAYGKPFGWVEFSDRVIGDGTKFQDFYQSIDHVPAKPFDARQLPPPGIMARCVRDVDPTLFNLEPLWQACPFRK